MTDNPTHDGPAGARRGTSGVHGRMTGGAELAEEDVCAAAAYVYSLSA